MTRRLIDRVARSLELPEDTDGRADVLLHTEWIVTNGLGGYSSCTCGGVVTRRYHGILVAALPNPVGRIVMLNHLGERLYLGDRSTSLNLEQGVAGAIDRAPAANITSMRLDRGLPVWDYTWGGVRLEKRILMPHAQNSVHVTFTLVDGAETARLELQPALHFRGYEDPVNSQVCAPSLARYEMSTSQQTYFVTARDAQQFPQLRMRITGSTGEPASCSFISEERLTDEHLYPVEQDRGYEFRGSLWTPGRFDVNLNRGESVTLIASAESDAVMLAMSPEAATSFESERRRRLLDAASVHLRDETGAELVLSADQFIVNPRGRIVDATRAAAMGSEVRTVIAGYHWFTDWGRDTMISLEGLTLVTGRTREAGFILRTFADHVRDGLIPNMFPDGANEGLYHTADATLWFFHAMEAYVRHTGDQVPLLHLLPTLVQIVEQHVRGTKFGIKMDPVDGLLIQGAEGYQLTWMDAKVDGWVVTPRRGKAVEINALWYNALRLLETWLTDIRGNGAGAEMRVHADRVYESFNRRFWIQDAGYLFDVVDGDDGDSRACRPNQVLSISLDYPVLDRSRWESVMNVVEKRLVTPVGLRSLAPGERDYKSRYFGDLRSRDAAYHQGTVWTWLIGPWVDAWLKLHPDDRAGARRFLEGCVGALSAIGLGTLAEIFDAEPPYTPRGCIAQAWSVAEVLRCWVKTEPETQPLIESRS
ncbi:MAG TPA: amylo-alpha-1,6-glucosidase [Gemmatimonadaceae bacterium]